MHGRFLLRHGTSGLPAVHVALYCIGPLQLDNALVRTVRHLLWEEVGKLEQYVGDHDADYRGLVAEWWLGRQGFEDGPEPTADAVVHIVLADLGLLTAVCGRRRALHVISQHFIQ